MIERNWTGLYKASWKNEIVPEAFSHPAKFARGLIRRIYEHALERGYLKKDQTVLDPFGGVALGAIDALANGLNFIGIELEQNFVDLGGGCDCTGISKADWVRCIGRPGRWKRFAHKDGRHWCPRCLAEAEGVIEPRAPSLPGMGPEPTASYQRNSGKIPHTGPHRYAGNLDLFAKHARNGATAVLIQGDSRNLVEVLDGARAEGIIASPPFSNSQQVDNRIAPVLIEGSSWKKRQGSITVGTDPAQLGNMPTGEPPADYTHTPGSLTVTQFDARAVAESATFTTAPRRGESIECEWEEGDVDAVIASPPYAESIQVGGDRIDWSKVKGEEGRPNRSAGRGAIADGYGTADGQLAALPEGGQLDGMESNTFWSAACAILLQCHQVLAPGGVAIFVTKRFVRNKAIVEFGQQWADLCQSCGFELVEWIKAWLVEEQGTQYDLTGDAHTKTVKRFSFFRRLHAQKYPHLAIEWEDVLVFRKPNG